jgi:outer membrane lipoprotein SlyB
MKIITLISALLAVASITGCASNSLLEHNGNPDSYGRTQAMNQGTVIDGTVVQVRPVRIEASNGVTGLSAAAGGITGVALTRKNNGAVNALAGMAGAAAGAVIGQVAGASNGTEIVVQLPDNSRKAIVQNGEPNRYRPGDRVYILTNGWESRVVGLNTAR